MTKVMISFSLYSDNLIPEVITDALKIKPTAFRRKGDVTKNGFSKDGYWQISTDYIESMDISHQFLLLTEILSLNKERIREVIRLFSLSSKFDVVVKVENDETPGMSLDKEILSIAYEFGATFDFDLYIIR